jgi:hypothetical protein
MNINDIRDAYVNEGFGYLEAVARASNDIILALIAKSPLAERVTIKGGVVMQYISEDSRRATQDLDLDFIKYSLSDESIMQFVNALSSQSDDYNISIVRPIEELKHQDYHGKRAHIHITDAIGTSVVTKLDMGVHKDIGMEQDVYCFELNKLDDSVTLFINTKEQILIEKLKSLLRLGVLSTRFKDIFDMYWLVTEGGIDKRLLMKFLRLKIFEDPTMREENMLDIVSRLDRVLNDSRFLNELNRSNRHNWLVVDPNQAAKALLNFFNFY